METIRRLFGHMRWADETILTALDRQSPADSENAKLFRHVLIAERVWLTRLEGNDSSGFVLWADEADLTELKKLARNNADGYDAYVARLTEQRLDEIVTYRNMSGVPFRTSVRDILLQVALHGQYHRGQINRALRQQSLEPVNVDYITYERTIGSATREG
ncbi:DinB family protein [Paenibacillus flagellatus]|uniref:Damage-inducible protein DinB n=1 Tax=Paenibacillus flagellatus TaxID=2211139 RepID=A0A2V5KY65_9BACL|nr:DinB family protein [Paenibacillus flagellatus]PYI54816.1 damage-inducible protein DinB [Paenibacillus flagellatus]